MHPVHFTWLTAAMTASLATASPAQAAGNLQVEEAVSLPVAPSRVWAVVGDFGSLGWHPVVATTVVAKARPDQAGAERTITTKDGATIVEALDTYQAGQRAMSYHVVQWPLPVTHYESTLKVVAEGQGSRVVWSGRFDRDPAAAGVDDEQARRIVQGIYQAGFDGLRQHFAPSRRP